MLIDSLIYGFLNVFGTKGSEEFLFHLHRNILFVYVSVVYLSGCVFVEENVCV